MFRNLKFAELRNSENGKEGPECPEDLSDKFLKILDMGSISIGKHEMVFESLKI